MHGGPGFAQPITVLTNAYDAVGNRTGLSDSAGGDTWFDYDGEGRLIRVTTPASEIIDLTYDLVGRLERIVSANTVEMQVLYDAATRRPGSIAHKLGAATLAQFDYDFDVDSNILSIADPGGTRNFTYDAMLQLTGGGYASAPENYTYDAEGNRTSSHLSASYTHDTANRLREDDETCYDYDANGNLVTKSAKVAGVCTGDETVYTWDIFDRLVRIDFADGAYAAYRYDALGRRIEKDVNGSITRYVYDGPDIVLEYDGLNVPQARYSHGEQADQPLAMERGGQAYFYHTDHLGSVRLLTDAVGNVANRYDYDAFGNLEATSYEGVTNPYTFTAREYDAESGLMFYRARYYDPKIGRFISEDPIGFSQGDLNLYRYVFNRPNLLNDPLGLSALIGTLGSRATITSARTTASLSTLGQSLVRTFSAIARLMDLIDDGQSNIILENTDQNPGDRTEPKTLEEKVTLEEAMAGAGIPIMGGSRKDPNFPEDKYDKMSHFYRYPGGAIIEIHYWRNIITGARFGFKFK